MAAVRHRRSSFAPSIENDALKLTCRAVYPLAVTAACGTRSRPRSRVGSSIGIEGLVYRTSERRQIQGLGKDFGNCRITFQLISAVGIAGT